MVDFKKIKDRLLTDFYLFWSNYTWLKVAICVVHLSYLQNYYVRRLAFYRHRTIASYVGGDPDQVLQPTLIDIGHDLIPDIGADEYLHRFNSKFLQVFSCFVFGVGVLPYFLDQRYAKPCPFYSINMAVRFLYVSSIGKILRAVIFLSTSLPGSAAHCMGETEAKYHPISFRAVFDLTQPRGRFNCGDLMFSGHMLIVTSTICFTWYYLSKMVSRRIAIIVTSICAMIAVIQLVLILLTRSHYTADLTLGIIVSFCHWHTHSYVWRPEEPEPCIKTPISIMAQYKEVPKEPKEPRESEDDMVDTSGTIISGENGHHPDLNCSDWRTWSNFNRRNTDQRAIEQKLSQKIVPV
eukprot:gb/GECG01004463.1/.p1 GENE.gb/GECG01004463.1/~~gb/GECG01004463.1/.p1  ORF type:complete len:351 (+),score=1.57 gb/GECG01004463.1/:1-1053(+)